jgi:hypothetical protein
MQFKSINIKNMQLKKSLTISVSEHRLFQDPLMKMY